MFQEKDMPINQVTATGTTVAANGADEQEEQLPVNPDQKVEVADASKDINIVPPPPTAGEYIVRWELGEKGVEYRTSKKSGTFIVVPLVGHIILEGNPYHDYRILDWINSIYNQLVGNTAVHDFLYKLGVNVPPSVSQSELKKLVEETIAGNPIGTINLEWKLNEKNPADPRANKDGYVTLKNKMRQFPRNPDGTYAHLLESKVDGSEIRAQAYVDAHLKK